MQPLDLRGVPPTVLFWEKGTAMTKPGPKLTPVVCVARFMVFTALRPAYAETWDFDFRKCQVQRHFPIEDMLDSGKAFIHDRLKSFDVIITLGDEEIDG